MINHTKEEKFLIHKNHIEEINNILKEEITFIVKSPLPNPISFKKVVDN